MKSHRLTTFTLILMGYLVTACKDDEETDVQKAENPAYLLDNQQNWIEQVSPTTAGFYDVFFIDSLHGWAVGFDIIVGTQDGGATWVEHDYDQYIVPLSVHFTDESTGWIVGNEGTFLTTTDGGENWEDQRSSNQVLHSTVHFTDQNTGWVSTSKGTVLKTVDKGRSWVEYEVGTPHPLEDLQFVNNQTGCVVGYVEAVFKTTDGGEHWTKQAPKLEVPEYEPDYTDVHFVDEQTGWITGVYYDFDDDSSVISYHVLLKTTNGGQTWNTQLTDTLNTFDQLFFLDDQNGWMTISDNKTGAACIANTTDGGENWTRSPLTLRESLTSIHFVDDRNGWSVGNEGVILRTHLKNDDSN